jgi:TRAP-type C4-dicarboxylate transport system permease small subunit
LTQASQRPWLMRAEAVGRWIENALLVGLFTSLLVLAVTQILLRNALSMGLPWADGAIRLAVLWLAVLGAVAASRDRKHIAINLSQRLLPSRLHRPVAVLVEAFTAAVSGWLAWYAWIFVRDSRTFGDLILGDWPAWIFQAVLPAGFALIGYRYGIRSLASMFGVRR